MNFQRVLSHCKNLSNRAVKLNFYFRDNFYFAIVGNNKLLLLNSYLARIEGDKTTAKYNT